MVSSFKLLFKSNKNNNQNFIKSLEYIEKQLKWSIDDLVDAYFLAQHNQIYPNT